MAFSKYNNHLPSPIISDDHLTYWSQTCECPELFFRTAKRVEDIISNNGVIPATIAVIDGNIHVGMDEYLLKKLACDQKAVKLSKRDLPTAMVKKLSGGTTVAATMHIARRWMIYHWFLYIFY